MILEFSSSCSNMVLLERCTYRRLSNSKRGRRRIPYPSVALPHGVSDSDIPYIAECKTSYGDMILVQLSILDYYESTIQLMVSQVSNAVS